jgi:hypothetical protein
MPQQSSRNDAASPQTQPGRRRIEWLARTAWIPAILIVVLGFGSPHTPSSAVPQLLTAIAFAAHGTPEIRVSDGLTAARRFPELAETTRSLAEALGNGAIAPAAGIQRSLGGGYFSDQFWLYALLAAPFVALGSLVSKSPAFGFACVNVAAALVANVYLGRAFAASRHRLQARLLFLVCGTSFYLGWADPAVPVATAILIATLAATRAELGIGVAAAGFAAALSPSAIVILLFVLAWWWRLRLWPDTSISGPPAKPVVRPRDWVGVALGLSLTALPYWFFESQFGVSHPAARGALDLRLVDGGRFQSFFFDWNQGMVLGVPGLMFALSIATYAALFGSARSERKELLRGLFFTDLALTFFVMPALAARDFNSESSVFLRAAYVRAMPLLGSLFALLPRLPLRFERPIVIACAGAQLAVIAWNGPTGTGSDHLRFTPIAEFALSHFPALYDPDPEIFRERTLGRETPPTARRSNELSGAVVWPLTGRPRKILAPATGPLHVKRLCGPHRSITSPSVARMGPNERYLNAPFRCSAE